jgi:hypothetical protein
MLACLCCSRSSIIDESNQIDSNRFESTGLRARECANQKKRSSLLTSLGLTRDTVLLPENSSNNNNLNRNLISFISDYKKNCRKLSSFLLTKVEEDISESIQGSNDFAELSEHPINVKNAMRNRSNPEWILR